MKHKVLGPLGRLLMRIRSSVAALLSRDRRGSPATLQGTGCPPAGRCLLSWGNRSSFLCKCTAFAAGMCQGLG